MSEVGCTESVHWTVGCLRLQTLAEVALAAWKRDLQRWLGQGRCKAALGLWWTCQGGCASSMAGWPELAGSDTLQYPLGSKSGRPGTCS